MRRFQDAASDSWVMQNSPSDVIERSSRIQRITKRFELAYAMCSTCLGDPKCALNHAASCYLSYAQMRHAVRTSTAAARCYHAEGGLVHASSRQSHRIMASSEGREHDSLSRFWAGGHTMTLTTIKNSLMLENNFPVMLAHEIYWIR